MANLRVPVLRWEDGSVLHRVWMGAQESKWCTFRLLWPDDPLCVDPTGVVREFRFVHEYMDAPGLNPDGWPKPLDRPLEDVYCQRRSLANPQFAGKMESQLRDFAVATRLAQRAVAPWYAWEPGPGQVAVVDGPAGMRIHLDFPQVSPWSLTYDDEPFALLDLPGPALWRWDDLVEFMSDCGVPVQGE